jgi:uncharacterized membrane protein
MLFLFRGHNGPAVRAIVGALLLVVGIAVHGGAILAGIGVVLLVWAGVLVLRDRRSHVVSRGRMS